MKARQKTMNSTFFDRQSYIELYPSKNLPYESIWQESDTRKKVPYQLNLDGLYEVLACKSVVQQTDQYTSVKREPGKLEVSLQQ